MDKCFVIQPFDKDKFDKRYDDIFKPAISNAGLEPYRIDNDLSVRIPIDDIEKGINECSICFAEITTDNPNVWYELGYAFACGKDVVMVCSEERVGKFPFDIQHRHVLTYKTASSSDFTDLGDKITRKIKAFQQNSRIVDTLQNTPVLPIEGLKSHEIAFLIFTIENQYTSEDSVGLYTLEHAMKKAGYADIATRIATRTLVNKGMIETFKNYDQNNEYYACRLTAEGENWILSNQDQFEFRADPVTLSPPSAVPGEEDDLPF